MLKEHIIHSFRNQLRLMALFSICSNVLFLSFPLYSLQIYDRVLSTGSLSTLGWLLVIVLVCIGASNLLSAINGFCMLNFALSWVKPVREQAVKLTILHSAMRSPRMQGSQLIRDVDTVKNYITSNAFVSMLEAPWGVVYLGLLFFIHPLLGWLAVGGLVLLMLLSSVNLLHVQRTAGMLNTKSIENLQHIDRALMNAEAMQAMGMASGTAVRWQQDYASLQALQGQQQKQMYTLEAFSRFARLAIQVAAVAAAAYLATERELTSGSIMASSMLTARVFSPFETLFLGWQRMAEARKAWERVALALQNQLPPERNPLPADSLNGAISLEGVVYGVSSLMSQMIIKGVTFQLPPGEILGIVGPVASGKSTLARLILGLVPPVAGCVRLDGVDVRQYGREQLGAHIGYVPQNIQLFPGTVRDNIARMDPAASEQQVTDAATMAGVHETILRLPDGYNTPAETLSAGQAQLVALARAFYGSPKLLVLDEPDSALEPQSERIIAQALHHAKRAHITTIIISHRRYVLGLVSRLLVLKNGGAEHFGATRDVLARMNASTRPAGRSEEDSAL